jgi:CubicO group peptidase (beta-lactamase class C family)
MRDRRRHLASWLVATTAAASAVVPIASAHATPAFVAYHDRSASYNQQQMNTLPGQGYRPISLSVYDNPSAPKYAAVWVKRTGPAFHVFSGIAETNLQAYINSQRSLGYYPAILTATGPAGAGLYAGMTEASSSSKEPLIRFNLSKAGLDAWNNWAVTQSNRYTLRWAGASGTASTPAFLGVWWPNPLNAGWDYGAGDSAATFGSKFSAYVSAGMRPDFVAPGPTGYLSVWRDDVINSWSEFNNMTSAQYQSTFNSQTSSGHFPIRVQAYGSGSATRFAAIFAADEVVYPRTCSATGVANSGLAGFDNYVTSMMRSNSIRAGQLAVTKKGKLLYARGFTCAETGYQQTQPTSLFRIASTSKSLTSIAVHQLIDLGQLHYTDTMQSILNVRGPNNTSPADSRWNSITIDQLLTHQSGLPQFGGDVTIVTAAHASLPATKTEWASWAAGQPLRFNPGSMHEYNNLNFNLLGQIVEKKRGGQAYSDAVKVNIFQRLGVTRPRVGGSLLSERASGEVRYYPKPVANTTNANAAPISMLAKSVMTPAQPIVPSQYGGRNIPLGDGAGAWILAAPDYAKVLAAFDQGAANPLFTHDPIGTTKSMWTSPDNTITCRGWFAMTLKNTSNQDVATVWHNGGMEGTAALIVRRRDGLNFVLLLDSDIGLGMGQATQLSVLANNVTAWPTTDLFPSVGIPSF